LIRSLPKTIRRLLVPAPDTARRALAELRFGQGDLREALSRVLSRIAGQQVSPRDFEEDKVPDSLRMNVRVVDAEGNPLAHGRDVDAVRRQLGMEAAAAVSALDDPRWNRDGLVTWDLDELPEEVELRRGGLCFKAYPMLVNRQQSVSLRLTDSPQRAAQETRHGLRRLFVLAEGRRLREQVGWLPGLSQMLLNAASIRPFDLRQELAELVADRAYLEVGGRWLMVGGRWQVVGGEGVKRAVPPYMPPTTYHLPPCTPPTTYHLLSFPRTKAEFDERLKAGRERLGLAVQEVMDLTGPLLEAFHQARLALEQATGAKWAYAAADVREQLDRLITPGFLTRTPWDWLKHFPRYLRAIPIRLESLRSGGLARDRKHTEEIRAHWQAYSDRARQQQESGIFDPELDLYRWMLEEYRVSCFAQRLGTAIPVSAKRLERQWERVRGE
jgi:ATP-dependent helicase HrpA